MGAKSNYLAKKALDHILGGGDFTRPTTVYIALCTARPTMADTGSTITEANYTGYSRLAVTNNSTNFPAATEVNQSSQTSGTLDIGYRYLINNYVSGDDFTNVGAPSNATGVEFVASGTTPAVWTNGSSLKKMGVIKQNGVQLEFEECTAGSSNVGWVAVLDASTGGNLLYYAALENAKQITAGDKPIFPAGSLKFIET